MVKPKFSPRVILTSNSKAKASISRKSYDEKQKQIEEAVKFCKENDCKGKKALATGNFPLIKDHKTITRRLSGKVIHGNEKQSVSILLPSEEECLVRYAKNKSRAMQPLRRADMNKIIMNILRVRQAANKKLKGGRKFIKLSNVAVHALEKGEVGNFFWQRLDAKHDDLTRKRVGRTSLNRALACTREMAIEHIDSLADELIKTGIMKNYEQVSPGVWKGDIDGSRVFNRDETPQAIRYGVDGTANNLAYCSKGETCQQITKENREYVTIEPFISLDGKLHMCHVIFAAAGITSAMAPPEAVEKIKNLLVSVTENGYQSGQSCFESCKFLDKILAKEEIMRPICMLTDGHSSRFDLDVLRINHEKEMNSHASPPDTTSTTQPLDQINSSLHTAYSKECNKFFLDNHINREVFMQLLADIWDTWTNAEAIIKAFKRCGISKDGLSVEWMQQDKMEAAKALQPTEESTPAKQKKTWDVDSPEGVRRNTKEYYQLKYESAMQKLQVLGETPISPDEVPGLLPYEKIRAPTTKKAVRLTQVYGSLEGSEILQLREAAEAEKAKKEKMKDDKRKTKKEQKESFMRCKELCTCKAHVCKASGFKECTVCGDIMKSQCTKGRCTVDGVRPLMVQSWYDVEKRFNHSEGKKKVRKMEIQLSDSDSEYSTDETDMSDEEEVSEMPPAGTSSRYDEDGEILKYDEVKQGMWVTIVYEGEKFLGKVQHKAVGEINVRCLEKPLGINTPQLFEHGDGIYYKEVYKTIIKPTQTQTGEDGKQKRKWFWIY